MFIAPSCLGGASPTGIVSCDRLVAEVMAQPRYDDARRTFRIVDNGSAHRGDRSRDRLREQYPRPLLAHGPVHARWLNQIEICFSIVQLKVLTPNDFPSLDAVAERLLAFQRSYETIARPFE